MTLHLLVMNTRNGVAVVSEEHGIFEGQDEETAKRGLIYHLMHKARRGYRP